MQTIVWTGEVDAWNETKSNWVSYPLDSKALSHLPLELSYMLNPVSPISVWDFRGYGDTGFLTNNAQRFGCQGIGSFDTGTHQSITLHHIGETMGSIWDFWSATHLSLKIWPSVVLAESAWTNVSKSGLISECKVKKNCTPDGLNDVSGCFTILECTDSFLVAFACQWFTCGGICIKLVACFT